MLSEQQLSQFDRVLLGTFGSTCSFSMSISFARSHSLLDVGLKPPSSSILRATSSRWISLYYPRSVNRAGRLVVNASKSESVLTKDPLSYKTSSEGMQLCIAKAHVKKNQKVVVKVPRKTSKPRVILISGPTAVGKTRLSVELAKALGGEIVNTDSVQVYQGQNIGAAKATLEERQGVPHHMMDLVLPTEDYTTERFWLDARVKTEEILSKGLVPIVIGGTGLYMRTFIQNRPDITSHKFEGECDIGDLQCDAEWDWDYDFQAYFLYQHRADLFPCVDIRCEQMIATLLEETLWLINLGIRPRTNFASTAIGYEEAMDLLLAARMTEGVVTTEQFLEFLRLFMHNSKSLVKKQIAWFRKDARSDVRMFHWFQAGQPMDQMVNALVQEYCRPAWKKSELPSGQDLKIGSMKEQKRMKNYKPEVKIYSDAALLDSSLDWIKRNYGRLSL